MFFTSNVTDDRDCSAGVWLCTQYNKSTGRRRRRRRPYAYLRYSDAMFESILFSAHNFRVSVFDTSSRAHVLRSRHPANTLAAAWHGRWFRARLPRFRKTKTTPEERGRLGAGPTTLCCATSTTRRREASAESARVRVCAANTCCFEKTSLPCPDNRRRPIGANAGRVQLGPFRPLKFPARALRRPGQVFRPAETTDTQLGPVPTVTGDGLNRAGFDATNGPNKTRPEVVASGRGSKRDGASARKTKTFSIKRSRP